MTVRAEKNLRGRRCTVKYSANTPQGSALLLASMEHLRKEIKGNPKVAMRFLVATGMFNEDGTLKEVFQ